MNRNFPQKCLNLFQIIWKLRPPLSDQFQKDSSKRSQEVISSSLWGRWTGGGQAIAGRDLHVLRELLGQEPGHDLRPLALRLRLGLLACLLGREKHGLDPHLGKKASQISNCDLFFLRFGKKYPSASSSFLFLKLTYLRQKSEMFRNSCQMLWKYWRKTTHVSQS